MVWDCRRERHGDERVAGSKMTMTCVFVFVVSQTDSPLLLPLLLLEVTPTAYNDLYIDLWPWLSVPSELLSWSVYVTCRLSRSKIIWFNSWSGNRLTDGHDRSHYLSRSVSKVNKLEWPYRSSYIAMRSISKTASLNPNITVYSCSSCWTSESQLWSLTCYVKKSDF